MNNGEMSVAGAGDAAAAKHPNTAPASASSCAAPGICLFLGSSCPTPDGSDERTADRQHRRHKFRVPSHRQQRAGPRGGLGRGGTLPDPPKLRFQGKGKEKKRNGQFAVWCDTCSHRCVQEDLLGGCHGDSDRDRGTLQEDGL